MADNFEVTEELPAEGCTREDLYSLIETINPTSEVVDEDTMEVVDDQIAPKLVVPRWRKVTLAYDDFAAAALTNQVELFTLPAGGVVHATLIKHSEAFSGWAISAYTVSVGISGNYTKYAGAEDVFQAIGDAVFQLDDTVGCEGFATAGTALYAEATATGANLDAATAGSVDIWVLYSQVEV